MGDFMVKASMHELGDIMFLVHDAKRFMHANGNYQWDDEYPLQDAFEQDIKQGDLYVLKGENEIMGFICLNRHQPKEYRESTWISSGDCLVVHRMVIARKHAGKGIAQKMMRFAEEVTVKYGLNAIRTDTNIKNKPMTHIFEKLGYRFTGYIVLRQKPDLFVCYEKVLEGK